MALNFNPGLGTVNEYFEVIEDGEVVTEGEAYILDDGEIWIEFWESGELTFSEMKEMVEKIEGWANAR
jgi:hypothetical protein